MYIWYIDVSSPEDVPYFKVILNSHMEKNLLSSSFSMIPQNTPKIA